MMVAVEGSFNSALSPLLETLEDGLSIVDDRVDAYLTLTDRLRDDEKEAFSKEICKKTGVLITVYQRDMTDDNTELSHACLQALGFCLHHPDISRAISPKDASSILKGLCNTLLKTTDKSTCTRSLWCISKQNFPENIVESEIHTILCAVEHVLVKGGYQSMAVEHEAINVILRLLEQLPESMKVHAMRWGNLVYPMLLHSAHKIRERAMQAMKLGFEALASQRLQIVKTLVSDLKGHFIQEMIKLFEARQEIYVLQIWQLFVDLLGKTLHKGGNLINSMLSIVERGFKSPISEVRCLAYQSWKHLIDNFALDLDILCNHKRMNLLLQPFKNTAPKQESIALAKLDAWWHLVRAFDSKLVNYFDQVCVPLLQFTVGVTSTGQCPSTPVSNGAVSRLATPNIHRSGSVLGSPATPHINLPSSNSNLSTSKFKCIQSKGIEILAHFLAKTDKDSGRSVWDFSLPPLKSPLVLSSSAFTKVAIVLTSCVRDLFCNVGAQLKESQVLDIWQCLSFHMNTLLEAGAKRDNVEIFTFYLSSLQSIINSEQLTPSFTLKLVDVVSKLPQRVISSPAYHVGNAELMHGTPALYLIQQLFHHSLLDAVNIERYFCIFELLVECGLNNPTSMLRFTQSILEMLDKAAVAIDNKEIFWRIWSIVVNMLLQHIMQTNEVNQGDSLDHDFSTMYLALTLPVHRIFTYTVSQGTMKSLLKTWSELYHTFARCAALVATAEANLCCEDLCVRILSVTDEEALMDMKVVDALLHVCQAMASCIDFSTFSNQHSPSVTSALSPAKPSRKKYRPLGNLTLFTQLLSKLLTSLHHFCNGANTSFTGVLSSQSGTATSSIHNQSWSTAITSMIIIVSTLFSHITMATMLLNILQKLSQPMAHLFEVAAKPPSMGGIFTSVLNHKLDKLWDDMLTAVESRCKKHFDSEFLTILAPLLQAAFVSPRRSVKNKTVVFWNSTFGKAESLEYPATFIPCLRKLKEKMSIDLPGFDESEVNTIEETPCSLGMDTEASQVMGPPPVPVASIIPTFGQPSPKRMHGSFLKKTAGSSPLVGNKSKSSFQSPNNATARRKLPLAIDEDSTEFVKITASPVRKRVLTEHQKEVLRSRTTVPAMYNDLDASQDTNLMAELLASQSMQETQEEVVEQVEISDKKNDSDKITSVGKETKEESDNAVLDGVTKKSDKGKKCVSFAGLIKQPELKDAGKDVLNGKESEGLKKNNGKDEGDDALEKMSYDSVELFSDVRDPDDDIEKVTESDGVKTDQIDSKVVSSTVKKIDDELPWEQEDRVAIDEEECNSQSGYKQVDRTDEQEKLRNEENPTEDAGSELDGTINLIAGTPPKEPESKTKHRRVSLITLSGRSKKHQRNIDTEISSTRPFDTDATPVNTTPCAGSQPTSDTIVPDTQSQDLSQESQSIIKSESATVETVTMDTVADSMATGGSEDEDSEVVIVSQPIIATPVLKLKRLTEEDIKKYSPKKSSTAASTKLMPASPRMKAKKTNSPKAQKQATMKATESQETIVKGKRRTKRRSIIQESATENVVALGESGIEGVTPFPIDVEEEAESQTQSQDYTADVSSQEMSPIGDKQLDRKRTKRSRTEEDSPGRIHSPEVKAPKRKRGRPRKQSPKSSVASATDINSMQSQGQRSRRTKHDKSLEIDVENPQEQMKNQESELKSQSSQDCMQINDSEETRKHSQDCVDNLGSEVKGESSQESEVIQVSEGKAESSQESEVIKVEGRDESSQESEVIKVSEMKGESSQESEVIQVSKGKGESSQESEVIQVSEMKGESSRVEIQSSEIKDKSEQECEEILTSEVKGESSQKCDDLQAMEVSEENVDKHDMSLQSVDLFASQKDSSQQVDELTEEKSDNEEGNEMDINTDLQTSDVNSSEETDTDKEIVFKKDCVKEIENVEKTDDDVVSNTDNLEIASENEVKDNVISNVDTTEKDLDEQVKTNDLVSSPNKSEDNVEENVNIQESENKNTNIVTKSPDKKGTATRRRSLRNRLVSSKKEKSPKQTAAKKVLQRVVKSPIRSPRVTRSQKSFISHDTGRKASAAKKLKPLENKQESLKKASNPEKSVTVKEVEDKEDEDDDWDVPLVTIVKKQQAETSVVMETKESDKSSQQENVNKEKMETDTELKSTEDGISVACGDDTKILEDSSSLALDNQNKPDEKDNTVAPDNKIEEGSSVAPDNNKIEEDTSVALDNNSKKSESDSSVAPDNDSKMEEENPVAPDDQCKDAEDNSLAKTENDSERIDSSQSPPKQNAKTSQLKESSLSSPQGSPVASRRFIFPKLSNLSSPSRREKRTSQGSPSRLLTLSPVQAKLIDDMYSPKTSPGGGILKRKCTDSPSPPNKMRRVSFAEPLEQEEDNSPSGQRGVNRCLELNKTTLPPSPLVTTTPSKVITSQSKFMTTPSRHMDSSCKVSPGISRSNSIRKRRLAKMADTQSQESQEDFESQDVVYPDLDNCASPVEKVLPQLTSSVWSRGLGQLVRARNIHTVGNLCSLTCGEIQNLPIRSPKVQTIRKAMSKFQKQLNRSNKSNKPSVQQSGTNSAEESNNIHTEERNNIQTDKDLVKEKDVAELLEDSGQLLNNISKLSDVASSESQESTDTIHKSEELDVKNTTNENNEIPNENTESLKLCKEIDTTSTTVCQPSNDNDIEDDCPPCKKPKLGERLADLVGDFTEENLMQLSSEEIFQAHQNVSVLMNSIVGALKNKCK